MQCFAKEIKGFAKEIQGFSFIDDQKTLSPHPCWRPKTLSLIDDQKTLSLVDDQKRSVLFPPINFPLKLIFHSLIWILNLISLQNSIRGACP